MNRALKLALLLLGGAIIGCAIQAKLSLQSPMSAWENSLANDARKGDLAHLFTIFREIMSKVQGSWNPVIFLGLLVLGAACLLKTRDHP